FIVHENTAMPPPTGTQTLKTIVELLSAYEDIFQEPTTALTPPCSIPLETQSPIKSRFNHLTFANEKFAESEIKSLLEKGLINESSSSFSSPVVVVAKKDGSKRLYRLSSSKCHHHLGHLSDSSGRQCFKCPSRINCFLVT